MSSNSFMAEVLAAGFFAFIWIALLIIKPLTPESLWTVQTLDTFKDYAPVILIGLLITWYSIGWLVNLCSYELFEVSYFTKYKQRLAGSIKEHRRWSTLVHHHANQSLRAELSEDRRIMRIARTGALNFFFLAGALLTIKAVDPWLALLPLILAVGSCCQSIQRGRRYYNAVKDFYNHIAHEHHQDFEHPEGFIEPGAAKTAVK